MQQSPFFVQLALVLALVLALKYTASEARWRQFNLFIAKCIFSKRQRQFCLLVAYCLAIFPLLLGHLDMSHCAKKVLILGCCRFWRFMWLWHLVLISFVTLRWFWQREVTCVSTRKHPYYYSLLRGLSTVKQDYVWLALLSACAGYKRDSVLPFPEIISEKTAVVRQKWMKSWLTRLNHSYPINCSHVVFCKRSATTKCFYTSQLACYIIARNK